MRFDAKLLQHGTDLRPAAMHDHGIDAHGLQQHHVLGKVARGLRIAHGVAAVLDHKGLAGIALKIRQRFGKRFGLGEHRGIEVVVHNASGP